MVRKNNESKSIEINTPANKLYRALMILDGRIQDDKRRRKMLMLWRDLALLCLVGTMLPSPIAVMVFSTTFVCAVIVYFMVIRTNGGHLGKGSGTVIAGFFLASILSGCSPLLVDSDNSAVTFCESSTGSACSTAEGLSWSICGIPITKQSHQDLQVKAGIKKVFGTSTWTGSGVVSVTRLTIYGS